MGVPFFSQQPNPITDLTKEPVIASGADVNAPSMRESRVFDAGVTPLHIAVTEGNLRAVELLIPRGADVNALHPSAREGPQSPETLSKYRLVKGEIRTTK